jgi:hypothetical protein
MQRGGAHHVGRRLGLASLILALALVLGRPTGSFAADTPCTPAQGPAAIAAAPIDPRVAGLPRQFQPAPADIEPEQLIETTRQRVLNELREIGAAECYLELVPTIAERTAFLSPFEFTVVGYFERDPATRDELLRVYREDPRQALLRAASFWPSPRAEMLLSTPAFYAIDAGQVFVNLGMVTPETAPNVVAHEFWHALANVQTVTRADGTSLRTSGFWTEQRAPGSQAWRPVEEEVAGGVPTYLMNEAVAIDMEVEATGRQHVGMRPDLAAARETLHDLYTVVGREQVLRLYLASRSDELKRIAHEAAVALRPV